MPGGSHETGRPMTSRIPHNSDGESGARADDHGLNSVPWGSRLSLRARDSNYGREATTVLPTP